MRLQCEFEFCAAHRLPNHPGRCKNLHGHNYRLLVVIEGEIEPVSGMVADFADVEAWVQKHALEQLDHAELNAFIDNPTAENISRWIWQRLAPIIDGLVELVLYEAPGSAVIYRGEHEN